MFSRPRFKAHLAVVPFGETALFLLDEHRQVILEGRVYPRLAPLLDGREFSDIARDLAAEVPLHEIVFALSQLQARGVLVEANGSRNDRDAAFFESFRAGSEAVPDRRAETGVRLETLGPVPIEPALEAAASSGLAIDPSGGFHFVATDDYLRPELAAINEKALAAGRPWMLAKPVGVILWVGPIFVPGTTGCWSCLAQRLRANRQMEKYIGQHRAKEGPVITSRAALPSSLALGLNLASTEIAKWLVGPKERTLQGKMISLDLSTLELRHHVLVKRPQCPQCGKPEEHSRPEDAPVVLTSRKKRYTADGGHRTLTPGETFERFKHHVSPILGAVSDLQPALGARSELTPTFVAGHNFSMGAESIVFLRESLRGVSGGKGSTEIQAKVSGLCEAIERYSGIFWGDELSLRGSYETLAPAAIHPNACMGFSEDQFRTREEWNRSQPFSRCTLVPRPFDPTLEIDWTPLWSLTHRQVRYLPAAYCYYGHPEFSGRWCSPDSNGCAAGNTLEEAILQGFMELVERDAVALWWYNRIPRRGVDLDSFELPYLKQMQDYYRSLHREIWVLDVTSDLRITTLACVSRRTDRPTEDVLVGFGSHFDPRIAMLRAVTEVNQFLPSVAFTNPDGSTRYLFGDELARQWWRSARVEELDYLRPRPELPPALLSDFEDLSTDDLRTDVETCVDLARRRGIEVLVLDQTRPDIGLNVVRVAAPGLCHFWRRLGPKRLYEVPVERGWLERPLSPAELNPFTVFF